MNDLSGLTILIVIFVIASVFMGLKTLFILLFTSKLFYIFIGIIAGGWLLGKYRKIHPESKNALYIAGAVFLIVVGSYFHKSFFTAPVSPKTANSYSEAEYINNKSYTEGNKSALQAQGTSSSDNKITHQKSVAPAVKATDTSKPEGMFRSYHQLITDHKYQEAYQCFTPSMQESMGDYETWAQGYATTVSSIPEQVSVISNDGTNAVLSFYLKATDLINGRNQVQYFKGQCRLTKIDGQWKIAEISAQLG